MRRRAFSLQFRQNILFELIEEGVARSTLHGKKDTAASEAEYHGRFDFSFNLELDSLIKLT